MALNGWTLCFCPLLLILDMALEAASVSSHCFRRTGGQRSADMPSVGSPAPIESRKTIILPQGERSSHKTSRIGQKASHP